MDEDRDFRIVLSTPVIGESAKVAEENIRGLGDIDRRGVATEVQPEMPGADFETFAVTIERKPSDFGHFITQSASAHPFGMVF